MTSRATTPKPARALIALALCLALTGTYLQEALGPFAWLKAPEASAVGGYDAVNVLGPENYTGDTDWTVAHNSFSEVVTDMAYDSANGVIYLTGQDGTVFSCDTSLGCDEDGDWVTTFDTAQNSAETVVYDETNQVLYVGTSNAPLVFRCDALSEDCAGGSGWTEVFDASDVSIFYQGIYSLFVDSVNGVLYAGSNGSTLADNSIFRCDINDTNCTSPLNWYAVGAPEAGTRILDFTMDTVNGILYPVGYDSADAHIGWVLRCDTASDCNESGDWSIVFDVGDNVTNEEFLSAGYDPDNGKLYVGSLNSVLYDCDTTTGCDDSGDWNTASSVAGGEAIQWDDNNGVLYSGGGSVYRCDTATGCDGDADWVLSLADGPVSLVLDTTDEVVYAAAGSAAVWRCETATGCTGPSELDNPNSIARDVAGGRLFVSDEQHHRVLVYDISDGLTDGEDPVGVLGQADLSGADCNRGVSADDTTLCTPNGLSYDESGQRLFVSDMTNGRVLVYDISDGVSDGEAAVNVLGQPDFTTTDCNSALTDACTVRDVAYDATNDRLFVADEGNSRVLVFDISGGITDGMSASNVLGETGNSGLGPDPGTIDPYGLAYDATSDRVFVADYFRDRVIVYDFGEEPLVGDGSGTIQPQQYVLGQPDFDSYGPNRNGAAGAGTVNFTDCFYCVTNLQMSYDVPGNRLLVPDMSNNRVLVFDVATITDGEDAVDVIGQNNFNDTGANLFSGSGFPVQNGLDSPEGLYYDSAEELLYVGDAQNDRVMVFSLAPPPAVTVSPHVATDVLGQLNGAGGTRFIKNGPNNGPNSRGFDAPKTVAVDEVNHRLFVADTNGRVVVFNLDTSNHLTDRVADNVLGAPDLFLFGDCGPTAAGICSPMGLAYSAANNLLYVSDFDNNRILVFDVATITDGEDAAYVIGQPDFTSSTGGTTDRLMASPHGLALDDAGSRLFVADQDNLRLLVFDVSLANLASEAVGNGESMNATNVLGAPDFTDNGFAVTQNDMGNVLDVEYDSTTGRVFAVEALGRVMVFDAASITDGEDAINVIGQDDFTSSGGGLSADQFDIVSYNVGLALDESGGDGQRLFVGDPTNHRVLVFDVDEDVLVPDCGLACDGPDAVNVLGQEDFVSAVNELDQDSFRSASGMVHAADRLYIGGSLDTDDALIDFRVTIFDTTSITDGEDATDVLGQLDASDDPLFTKNGANNGPNRQGFNMDGGANVALDTVHDRIFVPDFVHNRILVFNRNSDGSMSDRDPDFVLGQPDFTSFASATSATGLWGPTRVAYDGCQPPDCSSAHDLLYVADATNSRVLVYDTTTITNGEAAIAVLGQPDFDTTGGGTSATALNSPQGVSVEPLNGILAVADVGNNRVVAFDLDTDTGLPLDGTADRVLGQVDFDSNSAGLSDVEMDSPNNVLAETNTDSLWVADSNNNRVLRFDLFGGSGVAALNALGQEGFGTNDANTTQNGMDFPTGLALLESDESDQRLFVGDLNNSRVLVFNTGDGIDDGEDAVDVYGQGSFEDGVCNIDDESVGDTTLCNADGVDYDEVNAILYVADRSNDRVMIFGPAPSAGGGSDNNPSPPQIGFTPLRIEVNDEEVETNSRNVLVKVFATSTDTFTGTVDILLSNDPRFATFIPFRYVIPERRGNQTTRDIWPKTMAWDLCFGLEDPDDCDPGRKVVYARFYVNVPAPTPQLLPTPETAIEHPDPTP